jgi:septal ring factor EnvC (AmiA/AmiB activator)
MNTNADQTDVLAQLEQARADLATAKQTIGSLQGQINALTAERDSAKASVKTLESTVTALTRERDTLKAGEEDFNKRLAAEIARHGIRNSEAEKPGPQDPPKLSATEEVLVRKGVKSLEDLSRAAKQTH